jgi:ABC-type Zn2+ transport system substrate-binding protein/surface adhesin
MPFSRSFRSFIWQILTGRHEDGMGCSPHSGHLQNMERFMQSSRLVWRGQPTMNQYHQPMKFILLTLTAVALLATAGCIFRGDRDHSDNRDRPRDGGHEEHSAGVDHGEHPGDMDHRENR